MNPRSGTYDAMYARYSSHQQDDSTSIAVQVEACERAAGKELTKFIDLARSGRSQGGRPELLRLIEEAAAGRIGRLYVYKYDRLGRAAQTHVLVEDLEDCGVEVVSVTEGTNALARGVQLVVSADFSRVLAGRVRDGLIQRHRQGTWTGGPAPYGYKVVDKKLMVDEAERAVVRRIIEVYLGQAVGIKTVARLLREWGVPTRLGGPWCGGTVRSILLNRMLVGQVRFLRRSFKLDRSTGRRLPRFNAAGREMVRRDEALRIVSDAEFAAVGVQLASNSVARPRAARTLRPFTHRIRCACCGHFCTAQKSENGKGGVEGGAYYYYRCGRRMALGKDVCGNAGSVREDRLLARVQEALAGVFENMEGALQEAAELARVALDGARSEGARLRGELAGVDRELGRLTATLLDVEGMARKSLARQIAELEERREGVCLMIEHAAGGMQTRAEDLMEATRQAFEEARASFASVMTAPEVNRFVERVVGPLVLGVDGGIRQAGAQEKASSAGALEAEGIAGVRCGRRLQDAMEPLRLLFGHFFGAAA